MTRDAVIAEVLRRMGRYDVLDTTLQTNLVNAFNTVCDEFPQLHEWYCVQPGVYSFTLVAGTSDYALPSNCAAIWSVRDTTNKVSLQYADMRDIELGDRQTGTAPVRYGRWGDYVSVDPYPAVGATSLAVMNLRYTVPITQPTTGSETVVTFTAKTLPTKFQELMVRGTLYYAYEMLEMTEEALAAQLKYVGAFPDGPLGGYAGFLKQGETKWQQTSWDAQMQPRFK